MKAFDEKVVLVTGAATGIGRATALEFARQGGTMILADVNRDAAQETLRMVKDAGAGESLFVPTDTSSEESIMSLFQTVRERFGRLDAAYNNAGVGAMPGRPLGMPLTDFTAEDFDFIVGVNMRGTWLCLREELRMMAPAGRGAIVNVASVLGKVGMPGTSIYSATKHAIVGLTKTAALEMATAGVRVNVVCPGGIATPLVDQFVGAEGEARDSLAAMHPMKRIGTADEVARAVVWLCSESASYITGAELAIDGGFLAQ